MSRFVERYADLADRVRSSPPRLGPVRFVAVDGPAGSGKTTFAERLRRAVRATGTSVAVVHTDDLLDGWSDIIAFWPRLDQWVLDPLRRGEDGAYRAYDWHSRRFADRWTALPRPAVLILEGVSSARAAARTALTLGVYVHADQSLRLARGLARDGEALRPQWVRWMADEAVHFAADRTIDQVDLVVDGAPDEAHDPEVAYVRHARWVDARSGLGDDPEERASGRHQ